MTVMELMSLLNDLPSEMPVILDCIDGDDELVDVVVNKDDEGEFVVLTNDENYMDNSYSSHMNPGSA